MKKNGFVFVETIVVCAILASSLVAIYSAFVLIINNYKQRSRYDQAQYNYRAYYAVKSIDNPQGCVDDINLIDNNLKNNFQIQTMRAVKTANLNTLNDDNNYFMSYIKTIDESQYSNSCLYIFEFKNPQYPDDESKNYFSLVSVELGE